MALKRLKRHRPAAPAEPIWYVRIAVIVYPIVGTPLWSVRQNLLDTVIDEFC